MRLSPAVLLLLLVPVTASAQMSFDLTTDLEVPNDPFSITVTPQYPAPYSDAVLSFVSGGVNLSSGTLTVAVGGRELYRGGAKPVAVPLGRGGAPVVATVRLTSAGETYTKTVRIVPQDVSLVAEPLASVPPLYPGKPQAPLEGAVRVVAVAALRTASGAIVNPATASYAWTIDGVQSGSGSGIGRNALQVPSPLQFRGREVAVTVTSADGTLVGGTSFSFAGSEPTLRIYENDPLLGIRFDRAIGGSYAIGETEASLYAASYGLPTDTDAPLVQWFLNGTLSQTGESVTLRPSGGGGAASLSVTASSGSFSKAVASIALTFGASSGGFNFFGL